MKTDNQLLEEIKKHIGSNDLIFNGIYKQAYNDKPFGFFFDIFHEEGRKVTYPTSNETIEKIFIPTSGLQNGIRYSFLVEIASNKERAKQHNPFLLQAKVGKIEEVIQLTEIQKAIKEKKEFLAKTTEEHEKQIEYLKKEKEKEFNEIYNNHSQTIEQLKTTTIEQENIIENYKTQINNTEDSLAVLTKEKLEMESTIKCLRKKIKTCKNLEFLSEQDANQYLDSPASKPFEILDTHLDFEKDFLGNQFPELATHIQHYLYYEKDLIYTDFQIRNFLSLLMTNDLIVLSGLSGSGKTQIVKSFAEALGGVAKIIPVKPNWTSSDDLLGYYNPIQSSFLPTPFTEAIAEAIQNPHKLYLICLDEMNLARVEYYFADFLSKMEERNTQPEIDLYAKHEEELFVSEFKTLLTLLESSIGTNEITTWQEFLETDNIRNRFFELLGNTEKETLLQIHSKMKRRLLDILKFPATIKIPNNVRFIGAINVDETTHYFSPKILDRVHIVKFENPLLIEDEVKALMKKMNFGLKPIYLNPTFLGKREEYPATTTDGDALFFFKTINSHFLLPLNIDFGIRSIRQALNYISILKKVSNTINTEFESEFENYAEVENEEERKILSDRNIESFNARQEIISEYQVYLYELSLNTLIVQKILPRMVFDGHEKVNNGENKIDILEKFLAFVKEKLPTIEKEKVNHVGYIASVYLQRMIDNAKANNGQVNFYS